MPFSNNSFGSGTAVVPIDRSGTITLGGTAQVLMVANPSRGGWYIFNNGAATLYVSDLGTATTSSLPIVPGQEYLPPVTTIGAISILGTNTSQSFLCREWNGSPAASAIVNGGLTSSGPLTSVNSLSVIPSTNYTETEGIQRVAQLNGVNYSIGDVVLQKVKVTNGVVSSIWYNLTTGLVMATPPGAAQVLTDFSLSNPARSIYTAKRKWFLCPAGPIATTGNIASIRNNTGVHIRLTSCEIYGANNIYAAAATAQIMGVSAVLYSGSLTVTGGSSISAVRVATSTYSTDATVSIISNYTSVSGGSSFQIGTCVINCPAIGPALSISDNSASAATPACLQNLLIPAGCMVLITGLSIGSFPLTPALLISATLTEEI